jgi:hypothetical protein
MILYDGPTPSASNLAEQILELRLPGNCAEQGPKGKIVPVGVYRLLI